MFLSRLPFFEPKSSPQEREEADPAHTANAASSGDAPSERPYANAAPALRRIKAPRPQLRLASPPPRLPPPQTPPPLPPWPPRLDVLPAPGVAPSWAYHRPSPHPPARLLPRGILRNAASGAQAAPRAPAALRIERPNYGYAWRIGAHRPIRDHAIAGGDVFEMVRRRSVQRLQALIEQTPEVLIRADAEYARTPLSWAVLHQRLDVVRLLVSAMHAYGCDQRGELDAAGLDYRTPLMLAVDATGPDALALLDTLLAAGACVHVRTRRIAGPLGSFLLVSFGASRATQDVAEYAARKGRALALHQILKWDEKTPHGPAQKMSRLHLRALTMACREDLPQLEAVRIVLGAARLRRAANQSVAASSELEGHMLRLGIAPPGARARG